MSTPKYVLIEQPDSLVLDDWLTFRADLGALGSGAFMADEQIAQADAAIAALRSDAHVVEADVQAALDKLKSVTS